MPPRRLQSFRSGVLHAPGNREWARDEPPVLFAAADAVDHSSFWDRPPAVAAFERWLTG